MEEVLIEPYITIKLDSQHASVVSDWTGSPTTEQFKDGKNRVLGLLSDKGSSIMVLNYRNMTAYLNLETQVWTINDWFPRVLQEENIKRVGIVIPDKVVAQIVVKSIFSGVQAQIAQKGIEVGYFDDYTQLRDWLEGKKPSAPKSTTTLNIKPEPIKPPAPPKQNVSGVDLGGGSSSSGNYGNMDDVIHDDPFA